MVTSLTTNSSASAGHVMPYSSPESTNGLRVLMVHNRYRSRGGEDVSTEAEVALLHAYGHSVRLITKDNQDISSRNSMGLAVDTVWSRRSKREVSDVLGEGRFDVVHVQNFLPQFSPSIYYAARDAGVPVVQTLRNYRLLCPKGTLHRSGKICEQCLGRSVAWPGVRYACYRDSRTATSAIATMTAVHKAIGTWANCVTLYVTLTQFAREKLIQGGLPAERIVVKPNFVFPDPGFEEKKDGFAIYVGRLSEEKGIATLLRAWRGIQLPLKIVGEGPLQSDVEDAAGSLPQVEYLGQRPLAETYELMGRASLLVFPSECYETFGRVVAEAFSRGTPVVASSLGAGGELIEPGENGLHFTPGDTEDLARKVEWLVRRPRERREMGRKARLSFENKYSAAPNYAALIKIYERAIARA